MVFGRQKNTRKKLISKFGTTKYEEIYKLVGDKITYKEQEETKSRYYYIIAQDKREKKEILKKIKVKSLPFPKGDNQRYNVFDGNSFANLNGGTQQREDEVIYQNITIFDLLGESEQ